MNRGYILQETYGNWTAVHDIEPLVLSYRTAQRDDAQEWRCELEGYASLGDVELGVPLRETVYYQGESVTSALGVFDEAAKRMILRLETLNGARTLQDDRALRGHLDRLTREHEDLHTRDRARIVRDAAVRAWATPPTPEAVKEFLADAIEAV